MNSSELSLRQKIGQMIVCGFEGTEPSEEIKHLISEYYIGGIIYFRRNLSHVEQICELSSALQEVARQHSDVPLIISIDQEGGMVARMDREITLMPGNMALGATEDVDGIYSAANISATELRLMGINMNLAPCIDINNNPANPVIGIRSFGGDPQMVSDMGAAAIRGYQDANVASTVKHFPGHGDTNVDSHIDIPIINHEIDRLFQIELVPFIRAIEEGVDAIMTAHVAFPALESKSIPATLSQNVITGLLREQLHYDGVIITDCLVMNAISKGVGIAEGMLMAIEAGVDLVLISHEPKEQLKAIEALIRAVKQGRLSEKRINESVNRILRLKAKRKMHLVDTKSSHVKAQIGTAASWLVARELSEKSITLVKDEQQLPLNPSSSTYVIWPKVMVGTEIDEVIDHDETLGSILAYEIAHVSEQIISIFPDEKEIIEVIENSSAYEQIVFVSYNATDSEGQQEIVQQLALRENVKLIIVSVRNPYDLAVFPYIKTYLITYENRPLAMRSLTKVLLGHNEAHGKLPIKLQLL